MKFLHTMLRVIDLDASIAFYKALGLDETRRHDFPEWGFTLVFMALPGQPEIELTYNYKAPEGGYKQGDAFGHLAFGANDIYAVCEDMRAKGYTISREPGPMGDAAIIAFIVDPDGYKVELVQH